MGAEFDIFGGFIDDKALTAFEDLEKQAKKTAESMAKIAAEKDNIFGSVNKNQSTGASIDPQIRNLSKLTEENAKLKVQLQEQARVLKLNAQAAMENSNVMQRMTAQMKVLEKEMQAKFNPALKEQSEEFRKLNAEHTKLQAEYQRTARATGVMGRQMNSMYGSTFQLTQVMRELPNFAIDARVGFMALSNNLPMLADSFKQLKQQIIDTEGAAGASRKTWAAFGKSLLSLNTIMIVASTLLVLFGDDIVEFGSKLFKGQDAADKFTLSMKAMLKAATDMSGAAASSIEKIEKLGAQIRTYKEGVDDAQAIVKDFNETFGTHLTTINQVKVAYGEMAKAAIDGAIKMQAAMDLISQSSKQVLRGQNASLILSNFSEQQTSEMESRLDKYFNAIRERMKKAGADEQQIIKATNAEAENFKKGYFGATRTGNVILDAILGNAKEDEIEKHFGKIGKNSEMMIKAILNKRAADVAVRELRKSIDEIMPDTKADPTKPTKPKSVKPEIIADRTNVPALQGVDPMSFVKETSKPIPNVVFSVGEDINAQMTALNDSYSQGLIDYEDYLERRQQLYNEAAKTETSIMQETIDTQAKIDDEYRTKMYDNLQQGLDITFELVRSFYDRYFEMLEKEKDKQMKLEDEKLADIEDRERAGVITKEQAEEEKANTSAYYAKVDEEIERKKKQKEKEAFIIEQLVKTAQVWVNFAASVGSLENMLALGTLTPLYLTQALFSTGLIAAQTIPAFEKGGDVTESGISLVGEKRHELVYDKKTGKAFITPDSPTLINLERGMHVYPDAQKMDLDSFNLMNHGLPMIQQDDRLLDEMKLLRSDIRKQKPQPINGLRLMQQLQYNQKIISNRKSLLN